MTDKITRYIDIPQFTRDGNWQADFDFLGLVDFMKEEINTQGLQLNPDFQRGHVWTNEQQIAFLEYFLKGGKSDRTHICKSCEVLSKTLVAACLCDFFTVDVICILYYPDLPNLKQ